MITENGIVTDANISTAWIKTIRSSACKACSSKESCGTASDQKEMTVTVQNTLNVQKGDHVVIGLETGPLLFLTFLLYVFPILLLIIGAFLGNSLSPLFRMNPSFASLITGFSFFGCAFLVIRKKNTSLSKKKQYKPFLVRKRSAVTPTGCSIS